MIPTPTGPGGIPLGPEPTESLRVASPPAAAFWDELDALQRKVEDLAARLRAVEDRLARLESPEP